MQLMVCEFRLEEPALRRFHLDEIDLHSVFPLSFTIRTFGRATRLRLPYSSIVTLQLLTLIGSGPKARV